MFRTLDKKNRISRFIVATVLSVAMVLVPAFAFASPASDAQAEADAALVKLNELQTKLDVASNEYFEALSAKEAALAKIDEADARIASANEELVVYQERLGDRVSNTYRNGALSLLDIILECNTFEEFVTNFDYYQKMNARDAELLQNTKNLRSEIEAQKAILEEQARVASEKTQVAEANMNEASALTKTMQETYQSLSAEATELLEQEREAESRAAAEAAQAAIEAQNNNNGGGYDNGGGSSGSGWSEPEYNAATGNAVVDRAMSYVGNAAYVWGACSPGAFDCSGFVSYCLTGQYSRLGTTYTFLGWQQVYDPQPGDVCVNASHCGIYVGGGMMAHAATEGVGVIVSGVQGGMIYVRY